MAGRDSDHGVMARRLRGREIPLLTRSTVSSANGHVSDSENILRKESKAPNKRAAMDEFNAKAPNAGSKKRAALANLTNHSSSSRQVAQIANKSQISVHGAIASVKSRVPIASSSLQMKEIHESVDSIELSQFGGELNTLTKSSVTSENDENSFFELGLATVEKKSESVEEVLPSFSESKTVASLERKTQNSLYISRELKPRARQGGLFSDANVNGEGEGWSSKTYMDIDNHKDPQMCSAYAADIYRHLRVAELKRRPVPNFMDGVQQDINASMRGILVDWLVEVAEEYKLVPDTLYLTVSYIDRFLSANLVTRQRLQLLGVACMLIASKYEEICAPQVEEFCYITDNTYTREEVLEMERTVLNHLHFELTGPTTKSFLRRFIRAAQVGQKTPTLQLEFLGNYLAELTMLEYGFLPYLPSMVAGASVFLANLTLHPSTKPWNATLQHYSGYKPSELKECVKAIHELQKNTKNCTLPAIREKYKQHKFKCVATILPPTTIPNEFFDDLE